jgi:hypothetical protein
MNISKKIAEWKAKYGSVFIVSIEENSIYYRTLTAWEIQSIIDLTAQNKASLDIEEATCLFGVLAPSPLPTFSRPGSVSSLSEEIWNKSTLPADIMAKTIQDSREWSESSVDQNYNLIIASVMCKLMPSLDLAHLLELPTTKLVRLGAIVEKITGEHFLEGELLSNKQGAQKSQGPDQVTNEMADKTADLLANALKTQRIKSNK